MRPIRPGRELGSPALTHQMFLTTLREFSALLFLDVRKITFCGHRPLNILVNEREKIRLFNDASISKMICVNYMMIYIYTMICVNDMRIVQRPSISSLYTVGLLRPISSLPLARGVTAAHQ